MQLHLKVLGVSVLLTLAIIGVRSVQGDTNGTSEEPTSQQPTSPPTRSRWLPGQLYPTSEGALWQRRDLTLAEQALLDQPDRTMPGEAYKAYEAAAKYQASFAAANLASTRLGLTGIEEIGVVP